TDFPGTPGYDNVTAPELLNHPAQFTAYRIPTTGDDIRFPASDTELLLRMSDKGEPAMTSDIMRLSPNGFSSPSAGTRFNVTTLSADVPGPGVMPWVWDPAASGLKLLNAGFGQSYPQPGPAYVGPSIAFPTLPLRYNQKLPPAGSEYRKIDWRSTMVDILKTL